MYDVSNDPVLAGIYPVWAVAFTRSWNIADAPWTFDPGAAGVTGGELTA